jgi:hypothetical protein
MEREVVRVAEEMGFNQFPDSEHKSDNADAGKRQRRPKPTPFNKLVASHHWPPAADSRVHDETPNNVFETSQLCCERHHIWNGQAHLTLGRLSKRRQRLISAVNHAILFASRILATRDVDGLAADHAELQRLRIWQEVVTPIIRQASRAYCG